MRSATAAISAPQASRIELAVVLGVAWLLVIARSLVYFVYPHASFDSDQAVVGLMAKHLSEGRAFPLFFYGQDYLLAVESWLAVPAFWIAGPTVHALRASLIGTNLAVVTLLVTGLVRAGGLRPYYALCAAAFFAFAPPDTVGNLVDAGGGNVEPFLWVLLLWVVRARPIWFGSLLAIGFLNREFTIYSLPVLLVGQASTGTLFRRGTWGAWLRALVAFALMWSAVQLLRPLADPRGPGTRGAAPMLQGASTFDYVRQRVRIDLSAALADVSTLMRRDVPALVGGRPIETNIARQGHVWVGWMLAVAALAGMTRVAWLALRGRVRLQNAATGWYLFGVGFTAVGAYAITRPVDAVVGRYLLLALYVPIGATAIWLALEPRRAVRQMIVMVIVAWAAASAVDNWRQYERYAFGQSTDPMQEIIAALDARGVTIARAQYWRAYKIAFLTQERIKVASTDVVRIDEYERLAAAAGGRLVRLERQPCAGGTFVGGLYICD